MNNELQTYKQRFSQLLESTYGDVRPIVEDTGYTQRLDRIYSDPETARKYNQSLTENPHLALTLLTLTTGFIPVIGPFIASGIQLAEAGLYLSEGKNKEAGLCAFFALLPGIGSIVAKIPWVKTITSKIASTIASKLTKGVALNADEAKIVTSLNANSEFVEQAVQNHTKQLAVQAAKVPTNTANRSLLNKVAVGGVKVTATLGGYYLAGQGYNTAYDYIFPHNTHNEMFSTINQQKATQADINAAKSIDWK